MSTKYEPRVLSVSTVVVGCSPEICRRERQQNANRLKKVFMVICSFDSPAVARGLEGCLDGGGSGSEREGFVILNNTKKNDESSKLNSSKDSASWVEPKDAGQRRVQASGEPAGHWYTGLDGRKVYLNKSGKESTGRNAYRNYRKESGAASQKSKRKQLPRRESKL
ncbi:hypothetical protein KIW84_030726 [Lathyrus oleraceus]|uniref:Uncharacterized protein n=1 Tax=Pisum sativum TaxID=3888 RepID=A0A9D5AZV6_PEA|nr:hypothetical protein KIW84_030726 [Pisum sativum]